MDFHSLARKDLQALCKKNKIPANITNMAMADALKSLKSIEWDDEVIQKLSPQSDVIEQHGSPLPRSRRVTALSGEMGSFPHEQLQDYESEMKKKEDLIDACKTPSTVVRRSQRLQSTATKKTNAITGTATGTAAGTNTGTRRVQKKPEEPALVQTPATRTKRTAVKKAAETNAEVPIPKSTVKTTRQSTRKPVESVKSARLTRNTGKMMSLDQDEIATTETDLAPLKEVETTETEVSPLKQVEDIETEVAPFKEIEDIETEVAPFKEIETTETTETETASLKEVEAIETEIVALKEVEIVETEITEIVESVEEVEEQTELENAISVLSIENSNEEVNNEENIEMVEELINETPDQKELLEESIENSKESAQNDLTIDSPIMGIVYEESEIEANQEDASTYSADITLNASSIEISTGEDKEVNLTGEIQILSPVRPLAEADHSVDRMIDSVVRHFEKASIRDENKVAMVVEKEVNLKDMSLRKLKAIYKEKLTDLNNAGDKGVEGRRMALAELNENQIV